MNIFMNYHQITMVPLQEKIIYTVGPNFLYVFNKWSEFTSKVVRVQIKCLPI